MQNGNVLTQLKHLLISLFFFLVALLARKILELLSTYKDVLGDGMLAAFLINKNIDRANVCNLQELWNRVEIPCLLMYQ